MRISDHLEGVERDAAFAWTGPSDGRGAGLLCFAARPAFLRTALANPDLAAVIVPPELAADDGLRASGAGIAVADMPRVAFFGLHNSLALAGEAALPAARVHPSASVHPSAILSGGTVVEAGAEICAGAILGPSSHVGSGAFVGEGACIGAAGHFDQTGADGRRMRVRHAGRVHVGAGAQILAGAIVQRDVYAVVTRIGEDAVVGPGVRFGHGAELGANAVLAGGTVVAGYTRIGANAWCGPNATLGNKLEIGEGARVEIGSVVVRPVPAGGRVSGNFAVDHRARMRRMAEEAGR